MAKSKHSNQFNRPRGRRCRYVVANAVMRQADMIATKPVEAAPLVNRVDPDEHAIERGELCAHGVCDNRHVAFCATQACNLGDAQSMVVNPRGRAR
jgi:hypothetical protein